MTERPLSGPYSLTKVIIFALRTHMTHAFPTSPFPIPNILEWSWSKNPILKQGLDWYGICRNTKGVIPGCYPILGKGRLVWDISKTKDVILN